MTAVRVLIVDDHPIVRSGLHGMLDERADIDVVGEAATGEDGVVLAERLRPDVVLMDLRLPGIDGVEATRRIRAGGRSTQVLVLTTYVTDADILRAVEAGATGYLMKDAPLDDLAAGLAAAARGESVLAPTVARLLLGRMRAPAHQRLSGRELEVLGLVAKGLNNRVIARAVFISEATVKSHLLRIYGKLGVDDRTAAVTAALRRGDLHLPDG